MSIFGQIEKETLSEMSIKHLTRHIAGALQAIHQRQIIHRDIKPQNILLSFRSTSSTQSFKDATIKLADFGFARYLSSSDMAATLCGSPLYMAPEILLGRRYDSKVDLWSTGTILYQCLTGEAPFKVSMIIRINFNIRVLIDTI
jgi:serine/threonine-protein kinase ULK/ATG1